MATTPSRHRMSIPIHNREFAELRNAITSAHHAYRVHRSDHAGPVHRLDATQRLLARVDALQARAGRTARAKAAAHALCRMANDVPTTTPPITHQCTLPTLCLALVFPSHQQEAPHVRGPLLEAVVAATSCVHVRALALQELDLLSRLWFLMTLTARNTRKHTGMSAIWTDCEHVWRKHCCV